MCTFRILAALAAMGAGIAAAMEAGIAEVEVTSIARLEATPALSGEARGRATDAARRRIVWEMRIARWQTARQAAWAPQPRPVRGPAPDRRTTRQLREISRSRRQIPSEASPRLRK